MYKNVSRNDLLSLIAGSETAFDFVYKTYSNRVYQLAYKFLKDRALSEEVVQECFINLWTNRHKLDPDGNVWLYIFVIAKRLSLNVLRKACRSQAVSVELIDVAAPCDNSLQEQVWVKDLETYADNVINKLPKQQQLVYKMSRVEGLSHKEIAEQLQLSPNTVKNHMVEALKTLKANLQYADLLYMLLLLLWL